jgi:hypothetical protein
MPVRIPERKGRPGKVGINPVLWSNHGMEAFSPLSLKKPPNSGEKRGIHGAKQVQGHDTTVTKSLRGGGIIDTGTLTV